MGKVVIIRTRNGGTINANVPDDYNFVGTMKAVRSDGMIVSDHFMVPWDAIDSILMTDAGMTAAPTPGEKAN